MAGTKRKHGSDDDSSSNGDSGSDFAPSPSPPVDKKPDIKPDIKPKVTKSPVKRASPSKAGGTGKLPPGSKAALASLIVQRGLASLPSHAECAEIVSGPTHLPCPYSQSSGEGVVEEQLGGPDSELTISDGHDAGAGAQPA